MKGKTGTQPTGKLPQFYGLSQHLKRQAIAGFYNQIVPEMALLGGGRVSQVVQIAQGLLFLWR